MTDDRRPRLRIAAILGLIATLAAADAVRPGSIHVQFSRSDPARGFDAMTWRMRVRELSTWQAAYFFAASFYFENPPASGGTGYIGIQPYGRAISGGREKLAVFSVFGDGTDAQDQAPCEPSADGGPGQSCRVPYDWQLDRAYLFRVALSALEGDREVWTGSVTDTVTGRRTVIATWSVPRSWGLLSNGALTWTEHYERLPSCDAQPYMLAVYDAPIDYIAKKAYPTAEVQSDLGERCQNDARITTQQGSRRAVLEAGLAQMP